MLVPLLLAALAFAVGRGGTESDLQDRTETALQEKGISGAEVDFDGRDATVDVAKAQGVGSTDVESVVKDVDGVRTADVAGAAADGDQSGDKSGDKSGEKDDTGTGGDGDTGADANCDDPQAQVDKALGENKVHFAEKAVELAGDELAQVEKLATLLSGCGSSVTITGHTDDRARPSSPLSSGRANAVAEVFEAAGVTVTSAEGMGAEGPIGDNATQAGRDLNRFADIQVQ